MNPTIGKVIGRQAKQIIYNVYTYFKNRKEDPDTIEHKNDVNLASLVSNVTGLSNSTVRNIIRQGKLLCENNGAAIFKSPIKSKIAKKRIQIDNFTEGVIRRKITQYYTVKKEIPTLRKINAELKEDGVLNCSREYLRNTLQRLGFRYRKCQSKRKLLIERSDITSLRWHYLLAIKKFRNEGRPIFYLDETYVNQSHTVANCWQSASEHGVMTNIGKGLRLIIVHAGGRTGFVKNCLLIFKSHTKSGDYHGDMNSDNFEKWIKEKLLPNIPNNSVIVMDNAAYHCKQTEKKPTMSSTKKIMQEWLTKHNIPLDETLRKCDLMLLIDSQRLPKQYTVDEIINQAGHSVLRLPPYHPDLNPIEMVWGDIKGDLARNYINSNLDQKKDALVNLFTNYSAEKWRKCDDHIIKNEDKYYKDDRICDEEFDRFVISLNDDSDSSDDLSEDNTEDENMECGESD